MNKEPSRLILPDAAETARYGTTEKPSKRARANTQYNSYDETAGAVSDREAREEADRRAYRDIINPGNVIELKEAIDTSLASAESGKKLELNHDASVDRPLKFRELSLEKEELRWSLIESYLHTGDKDGSREISDNLRAQLEDLLLLDYEELEELIDAKKASTKSTTTGKGGDPRIPDTSATEAEARRMDMLRDEPLARKMDESIDEAEARKIDEIRDEAEARKIDEVIDEAAARKIDESRDEAEARKMDEVFDEGEARHLDVLHDEAEAHRINDEKDKKGKSKFEADEIEAHKMDEEIDLKKDLLDKILDADKIKNSKERAETLRAIVKAAVKYDNEKGNLVAGSDYFSEIAMAAAKVIKEAKGRSIFNKNQADAAYEDIADTLKDQDTAIIAARKISVSLNRNRALESRSTAAYEDYVKQHKALDEAIAEGIRKGAPLNRTTTLDRRAAYQAALRRGDGAARLMRHRQGEQFRKLREIYLANEFKDFRYVVAVNGIGNKILERKQEKAKYDIAVANKDESLALTIKSERQRERALAAIRKAVATP